METQNCLLHGLTNTGSVSSSRYLELPCRWSGGRQQQERKRAKSNYWPM